MPSFISKYVAPYAKAHLAFWGSAAAMLAADAAAGAVSVAQYEAAALVALGLGSAVALVPNKQSVKTLAPLAVAVAQDVAPAVVKQVAQDMTQALPIVQDVTAAAPAVVPAAVAAKVEAVAADVQAVVAAVEAANPTAAVPVAHTAA